MTTNSIEVLITACARIFSREFAKELKRAGFGDTPSIQIPKEAEPPRKQGRRLIAVNDWSKHHPHPSPTRRRWLISHAVKRFNQYKDSSKLGSTSRDSPVGPYRETAAHAPALPGI